MRTATFGLGKVAENIHLPACRAVNGLQVVAACDPDEARRQTMQQRFQLPAVYAEAAELLEKEQPELVIIGAPPDAHKALTLAALESGAHVLCEKPFMPDLAAADAVIAAAEKHKRLLAVNNQYRYMQTYCGVKEQLTQGQYGRLFFIQCWQQMFHPPALEPTPWRSRLKRSTLFEFGSHPLDLITHFFDALPTAVSAAIPQVRPEYKADVLVQMTLHFPEGRLATLALNRVSHAPERYLEMRLDCEAASLRLSLGGVARLAGSMIRYQGQSKPSLRFGLVRGGEARAEVGWRSTRIAHESQPAFASATAAYLRDFIAAAQHPEPDLAWARQARDILKIIFAGYEAAEKQSTVALAW